MSLDTILDEAFQWNNTDDYVTVTSGMSGYFAVHMWWNAEDSALGGFWEPYQSGIGRYANANDAALEAIGWAEAEEMRCTHKFAD